ncbi:MAG: three-Cys-motif partner protein TcmP [Alphaproteobacteria bacterium]|nr:three-Cys-motif partner protein TcmP [Alphaproteobacteria bacterium]
MCAQNSAQNFLYEGREQTLAKHILFGDYIKTLAYHILYSRDELVYVDGFSGPWESKDGNYSDTSFSIALKKLSEVRQHAETTYKRKKIIRCLFIEENRSRCEQLKTYIQSNQLEGIHTEVLNGDFENLISDIKKYVGNSFAFIFIDPTGWTGYSYDKIKPLFQQKGEFLINFMFNDIKRFVGDEREKIKASFEKLFGGGAWESELSDLENAGITHEAAVVELYCQRLRRISSKLDWLVTYSPILHRTMDRSWFYLIYATTHLKGLQQFHKIREKSLEQYDEVRKVAAYKQKTEKTGMSDLFGPAEIPEATPLEELHSYSEKIGPERIVFFLQSKNEVKYSALAKDILQLPAVTDKILHAWLKKMAQNNLITLNRLMPRGGINENTLIKLKPQ